MLAVYAFANTQQLKPDSIEKTTTKTKENESDGGREKRHFLVPKLVSLYKSPRSYSSYGVHQPAFHGFDSLLWDERIGGYTSSRKGSAIVTPARPIYSGPITKGPIFDGDELYSQESRFSPSFEVFDSVRFGRHRSPIQITPLRQSSTLDEFLQRQHSSSNRYAPRTFGGRSPFQQQLIVRQHSQHSRPIGGPITVSRGQSSRFNQHGGLKSTHSFSKTTSLEDLDSIHEDLGGNSEDASVIRAQLVHQTEVLGSPVTTHDLKVTYNNSHNAS